MALSSTHWALLVAATVAGAVLAAVLGPRSQRRPVVALLFLCCLALFLWAQAGYRRAARAELATRHFHAGLDQKRHGNLQEARRAMREVLTLDPDHPQARRELAALTRPPAAVTERQARLPLQAGKGVRPAPPLTRLFHQPSAAGITDYAMEVHLMPAAHTLRARATLTLQARQNLREITLALHREFDVEALRVNGRPARYTHTHDRLTIAAPMRRGATARVVVRYARRARTPLLPGGDLIDARGVYLRPESRWYPSVGELDFHAPLRIAVRVPRGHTAVCAGRLTRKEVGPREVTFHWESAAPMQMICLAAGRYAYGASARGPVVVESFLTPRHAAKGPAYRAATERILRFYAERFGAYAYPKLAIAEIPIFPGGYGSTTLLLLTEQSFAQPELPVPFLAHEIAHQWWGNHIAPRGLGAGWLSEAFAEYSSLLYQEHVGGRAALLAGLKELSQRYQAAITSGMEPPIAETDPYQQGGSYEGVIYYKGAYVLHSLRGVLGEAPFRRLLRTFAERYGGRRADITDFERLAAEVHGRPLRWFFDQWLRRPGALRLKYAVVTRNGQRLLTLQQEGTPYTGNLEIVVAGTAGRSRHTLHLEGPTAQLRLPGRGEVTSIEFDPERWWLKYAPRRVESLGDTGP